MNPDIGDSADPFLDEILRVLQESGADLSDPSFFEKELPPVLEKVLPAAAEEHLSRLKTKSRSMLNDRRARRFGFERRLRGTWGEPLDLLQTLVYSCLEIGESFNSEVRSENDIEGDFLFEALSRLHGRGCQTAFEVLTLLEGGYANGANARWRTLHELAVVSVFLTQAGQDTAEMYLLHHVIESRRIMLQYRDFTERLGLEPATDEEIERLEESARELILRFGESFKGEWGWAAAGLGIPQPNFRQIEEEADLRHFRPYFKMASHGVHAGPKGIFFNISVSPTIAGQIIPAGASNTGLADPAQLTALSLAQVTHALLLTRPTVERLIFMQVIHRLSAEVANSFVKVQREVEERTAKGRGPSSLRVRVEYWFDWIACNFSRLLR